MAIDNLFSLASSANTESIPPAEAGLSVRAITEQDGTQVFDLERFIWKHLGRSIVGRRDWQGSTRWTLSPCPFNPSHRDGSAYIVRLACGEIRASCHHEDCSWRWPDLFRRFEGGSSWDVAVPTTHRPTTAPPTPPVSAETEMAEVVQQLVTEKFDALKQGTLTDTQRALLLRIATAIQQISTSIVPPEQAVSITLPSVRYSSPCDQHDLQRAFDRIPNWVLDALRSPDSLIDRSDEIRRRA